MESLKCEICKNRGITCHTEAGGPETGVWFKTYGKSSISYDQGEPMSECLIRINYLASHRSWQRALQNMGKLFMPARLIDRLTREAVMGKVV
ncbi:hypothetical protein M1563_04825 [Patescibacteria group bacterium]|nr:hypothetical protein [Patescibacteria group bacterium]MCL5409474.1 hypothetical protein [Patescibacteria group bacterium]